MVSSKAVTVNEYLAELPAERRLIVESVRNVINAHLPVGYQEAMQYGMIGWSVPHALYPAGYHADSKQPLPLAALASQKQHVSLYLMGTYCGCSDGDAAGQTTEMAWFQDAWKATGLKLDMGKSCVRFRSLEQVPLTVIGEAISRLPVDTYIARYSAVIDRRSNA